MTTRLKPSEFVIPKENPFANDKLERKECADALTNLVQNNSSPLVISINGGWGTGKTVFLKMWKQDLQNSGFTTIYFNAWQDDYCHDALVALIGQIWSELKDSDFKEIAKSVKECAAPVFRATIFNAVRTMSAGIVDLTEKQLKSISEKVLDEYVTASEKLEDLKKRLSELAQKVNQEGKPLIIVIDELDRCRPTFAIELLEKIKHLFDTPGLLFVLGIDREQLSHSIKSVYGQEMDVDGYLRRFINIEFILPEAKPGVFASHMFSQLGIHENFEKRKQATKGQINDEADFDTVFPDFCACFQLSLRDIEHCCRLFALAYMNTEDTYFVYPRLLMVLVILKLLNSKLYYRFVSGYCNSEEIIKFIIEQPQGENFLKTRDGRIIEAYLIAASPMYWQDVVFNQMQLLLEKKALTHPEVLPNRIKNMTTEDLEFLLRVYTSLKDSLKKDVTNKTLGYLSKKIELASLMLDYVE